MSEENTTNTVTQAEVDAVMQNINTMSIDQFGKKITVTTVCFPNGFTLTETSTCVDPANYSQEIGEEVNRGRLETKVWTLLGFLLQERLCCDLDAKVKPTTFQERVIAEKAELDEKLAKLSAFFETETFAGLSDVEQELLNRQEAAMSAYSIILEERIELFDAE